MTDCRVLGLEPCPFCGSERLCRTGWRIECLVCGVEVSSKQVIERWNTRNGGLAKLAEKVELIETELAEMNDWLEHQDTKIKDLADGLRVLGDNDSEILQQVTAPNRYVYTLEQAIRQTGEQQKPVVHYKMTFWEWVATRRVGSILPLVTSAVAGAIILVFGLVVMGLLD